MKKIVIFSIAYYPMCQDAEIAISEITDRLSENEYYLITNKFDGSWLDEEKIGNINVRRIGAGKRFDKYLYPFRAIAYAANLHKTVQFDFAWSMMASLAGFSALFFKYKTKVPYLLTLQSKDGDKLSRQRTWLGDYFHKRVYREPKLTQVISKYLGHHSRRMGNKGEVVLVPNGIDLDIFKNKISDDDKSGIRSQLGIREDDVVIVTVANLSLKDGLIDLIKAMNFSIYKIGIPAKLLIFGKGPDEQKLMDTASSQRVADDVIFMGSSRDHDLVAYLELADIYCQSTLSESFGAKLIAAMALGTPVIAAPVAGISDFLHDGQTGLICQKKKPASIAQAIEKYIKNKKLYADISRRGKELVIEKFSWDTVSHKMTKVFSKMKE